MKYIYFGTPNFAVTVLEELIAAGYSPELIVTTPDKPSGRKLLLTPTPLKQWAESHKVDVITPATLRDEAVVTQLASYHADLFIVAAYGKIIPQNILDLPTYGTLNVHPSLLPAFRGSSPVESAIIEGLTETGVSIMKLDALMDHGPIIASVTSGTSWTPENPPKGSTLEELLAHKGGKLLAEIIPKWIAGEITPVEQNDAIATFCKKIVKEDGRVDINGDPILAIQKIRAYDTWPGTFFFQKHGDKDIRVRIVDAEIKDGALVINRVIPEGKKEMNYQDFLRGIK